MRIARRLKWDWIDTDNEIERRAGKPIREIFAGDGEPAFRELERSLIAELVTHDRLVISTGGGAILNAQTRQDLRAAGPVIWLVAPVMTIAARILQDSTTASRRPNLTARGGTAEIREVLAMREPLYRECATIIVETEGLKQGDVVTRILDQLPVDWLSEAAP